MSDENVAQACTPSGTATPDWWRTVRCRNMGPFDQVLRTGIGLGLVWFGFFDTWFMTDRLAGTIVGLFGVVNLLCSPLGFCPVYQMAGLNTRPIAAEAGGASSADLRKRMLAATIGVSVLVLAIFGAMAYRIADDVQTRSAPALLEDVAARLARGLGDAPADELALRLAGVESAHHFFGVSDARGRPLYLSAAVRQRPGLWDAVAAARTRGTSSFEFGGDRYYRVESLDPSTRRVLTLLEPRPKVAQPVLESLALKLAVLGVVVVWLAVWAALIIATSIGRRLDEQNAALLHQAQHDELTGLPNRGLLHSRLAHGLNLASQRNEPLALLIMDLDRFKEVNDTLGHSYGDELLRQSAARLQAALRPADTCARLGGDEFAIVLPDTHGDGAIACARSIQQALDRDFMVHGVSLRLRTSVGIAIHPQHGNSADSLIQRADVAMYDAKRRQSGHALYAAQADPNSLERLRLVNDLRVGIERGEFELHYQPKLSLTTSTLDGVEALVRWKHPQLGLVAPDRFIQLAEQNGLIHQLTAWVLREAIATAAKWHAQGRQITVAVNLSPLDLLDETLPTHIAAWLEEARLPPALLELELTESAAMDDVARAAATFETLSAMGIRIAIDDFGTGMSSLSYLKRLPFDDLKIDRSFVTDMLRDDHNAVLVRSIIDLAHNLGRRVIAEGIEDRDTLQRLQVLGCDAAQGYFISRPVPAAQLEQLLDAASRISDRQHRVTADARQNSVA